MSDLWRHGSIHADDVGEEETDLSIMHPAHTRALGLPLPFDQHPVPGWDRPLILTIPTFEHDHVFTFS